MCGRKYYLPNGESAALDLEGMSAFRHSSRGEPDGYFVKDSKKTGNYEDGYVRGNERLRRAEIIGHISRSFYNIEGWTISD